jgi:hypothetical protein
MVVLQGCGATSTPLAPGGSDELPAGWTCVGDPDRSVICGPKSDVWVCETLPNAEKKCAQGTPDGAAGWVCTFEGSTVTCRKQSSDLPPGGGGWTCTREGEMAVCVSGGTGGGQPAGGTGSGSGGAAAGTPGGGGSWVCSAQEEFVVCTGAGAPAGGGGSVPGEIPAPTGGGTTVCFFPETTDGLPPGAGAGPVATIVNQQLTYGGVAALYTRLTFSKSFVDNTYGANSSTGYGKTGKPHQFEMLTASDHAVLSYESGSGQLVLSAAIDYLSAAADAPSGYRSLGPNGGDGKMVTGLASAFLAARTSLDRNFNDQGYVLTQDSPATDASYSANPQYPSWNFAVEYETWVRLDTFGAAGAGKVSIASVHASPSRMGTNTVTVQEGPCPP